MNSFAILKGEKYIYVNRIKNIITDETAVLCKDECGNFYFCSIDEWVNNRPVEINTTDKTQVNKYSAPQQKIELYKSLFCGRTDVYAKRYYNTKTGKSGYVPACSNEWVNFVCDKKKYTCSKCPNRSFIEINDRVIYNHLKGDDEFCRDVVGLYAILPDEKTKFLAIDFDEESWQNDVTAVRKICREYNIPVSVERSRSGNGAHMWFFFEEVNVNWLPIRFLFLQLLLNTNYIQCFLFGNFILKIIISCSSCFFKPIIIFLKTQRLFHSIRCVKCSFITLIHFTSLCVKSFNHLISVCQDSVL